MADYTHISFTKLFERVNLLVNGEPAVKDVKYDKNAVFSVSKKNAKDVGVPFDTANYKAYKGDLESNESTIQLNLNTKQNTPPAGTDVVLDIKNHDTIFMKDNIVLNDGADRIYIDYFDPSVGAFMYYNTVVSPGQMFMKSQIPYLVYKASTGTGIPYQTIKYTAGNFNEKAADQNKVALNIAGLAYLEELEYVAYQVGVYYSRTITIRAGKLPIYKNVKFRISIDLTGAWEPGKNDEIIFSIGSFEKKYSSNIDEVLEFNAGSEGEFILKYSVALNQLGNVGVSGTIITEIVEVDSGTELIDQTKKEIIIDMGVDPDVDEPIPEYPMPGGGGNYFPYPGGGGGGGNMPNEPIEFPGEQEYPT